MAKVRKTIQSIDVTAPGGEIGFLYAQPRRAYHADRGYAVWAGPRGVRLGRRWLAEGERGTLTADQVRKLKSLLQAAAYHLKELEGGHA